MTTTQVYEANTNTNAQLITAAPELLEALKAMVAAQNAEFARNPLIESSHPSHPMQIAWLQARAAITKAGGAR